jgi:hypothetical protein
MTLPDQPNLPIHLLAACFNNTSATYKFYWFLAILGRVEQGETRINKHHLFTEMIAHSWFTVNYFHVSFFPIYSNKRWKLLGTNFPNANSSKTT